jgi:hypothetical protein
MRAASRAAASSAGNVVSIRWTWAESRRVDPHTDNRRAPSAGAWLSVAVMSAAESASPASGGASFVWHD